MSKTEKSCGAVVFTREAGQIKYLLIQNREGIYGFPKGHMEPGETEVETALREVREETQLIVALIDGFRTEDSHLIPRTDIMKDIVYFLGYFENQCFAYQKEELTGIALLTFEEALPRFQFESSKRILKEAHDFLTRHQT